MKCALGPLLFLSLSVSLLKAGSVDSMTGKAEVQGKLTLKGGAIQVEGGAGADIDLADVLEADFNDADFHLDYFSSSGSADQLPSDWKGQDIGRVDPPGTYAYAKGELTLAGNGRNINSAKDRYYYLGRPWTGNGEWTVHVKEFAHGPDDSPSVEVGLLLRDGLDPSAAMFGFGLGPVRVDDGANGLQHHRNNAGEGSQWNAIKVDPPFWFRVRRSGDNFDIALSNDGMKWGDVEQDGMKFTSSFQAGVFMNSNGEDLVGKAILDHVLFTPLPAESEMLPKGVLLVDGTFLAGAFNQLDPAKGSFNRADKLVAVTTAQVASVILDVATGQQLAQNDGQAGVLLMNGDFAVSSLQAIGGTSCDVTSSALGNQNYNSSTALAYVVQPVKPLSSAYEIRLKDGSSIRASGISADADGKLVINDVSGMAVPVDAGEIAQIRAGASRVQTLMDLPWKAAPATVVAMVPEEKAVPVSSSPPTTNTVTAVAAPASAPAPPFSEPTVRCWEGVDQEQIMAVDSGTQVNFPLTGKFRAIALKVVLPSDAPVGSEVTVRIMADGKEVGHAAVKAGDPPRLLQVGLSHPASVILDAGMVPGGAKILYLDPVVVRE